MVAKIVARMTRCSSQPQAGMKLKDLHDHLEGYQLALPNNGSISEQTIAGAFATVNIGDLLQHNQSSLSISICFQLYKCGSTATYNI